jgi:hypothetical protein
VIGAGFLVEFCRCSLYFSCCLCIGVVLGLFPCCFSSNSVHCISFGTSCTLVIFNKFLPLKKKKIDSSRLSAQAPNFHVCFQKQFIK